ncbi:MAG TPA: acetylxylan esterase [Opitutaceae bacterium]|nr:acetylxylan esterase [Opitutaceae bacterium]
MYLPQIVTRSTLLLSILCAPLVGRAVEIDAVPPHVTKRVATVQVRVAPDHRDWTYNVGEPVHFKVSVTADNEPIGNLTVKYTVGPEMMPAKAQTAAVPLEGLAIDGGTMKEPGFLRCTVSVEVAGKTYSGAGTAAFSPEKIRPTQTEPADFDAFWKAAKEELATVPIDATYTPIPEASTGTVNVYLVRLRNVGKSWEGPGHFYGILCEPKAPGKYPALLRVPGAGVRPYFGDVEMAEKGVITFEVGIHGIPVNMPKIVYNDLLGGALDGYWMFNLDDKSKYYYRRVYLGCVRANDFLTSLPNWDGKNLIVAGASQGGQLTIATTALDPRVTGLAVTHPAFCDVTGELHGRAGGWPHPFKPDPETGAKSPNATPEKIATTTYYDSVNFAKRIKVPGYYNWGYNDDTCPPTSTYAAYNIITAPKELAVTLELAHQYTKEQQDAINGWIAKQLGLK